MSYQNENAREEVLGCKNIIDFDSKPPTFI